MYFFLHFYQFESASITAYRGKVMGRPGKCGLMLFNCIFKQQFFRDACGLPWDRPLPPPLAPVCITVHKYNLLFYSKREISSRIYFHLGFIISVKVSHRCLILQTRMTNSESICPETAYTKSRISKPKKSKKPEGGGGN